MATFTSRFLFNIELVILTLFYEEEQMKKVFLLLVLGLQTLRAESPNLVETIEKTIPAVVFIANEFNPFDEAFDPSPDSYIEYIRPFYEYLWPPLHSHGSGFLISEDGYVVTNAHVVSQVTHTFIALVNHEVRVLKARVVGVDERTDIAVLKIESDNEKHSFPHLAFGDSDHIKIGEDVAIVGNPLSSVLESTVTTGIVSGRERRGFYFKEIEEFLQTDASINPGNSGGPVLNKEGEVIGIVSAGYFWFEGLNFVIPSQIVKKVVNQLIDHGEVSSGYLGVILKDDSETIFDIYDFDRNQGAVVKRVVEDTPAEEIGLAEGDVIIAIDGHPIKSAGLLIGQLALIPPYEIVELTVIRDGQELILPVEMADPEDLY